MPVHHPRPRRGLPAGGLLPRDQGYLRPSLREESRLAAGHCAALGKPYVTIDLPPEDFIRRHAAVSVISNEFMKHEYPRADARALFKKYADSTDGLVVFTFGTGEILFGRRGKPVRTFTPFKGGARAGRDKGLTAPRLTTKHT